MDIFADDAKIMRGVKIDKDCKNFQRDLEKIQNWSYDLASPFLPLLQ